jgi:5-(carboxyamino)imidazole ribonucleotide synthase
VPQRTSIFPVIGLIGGGQLARMMIQQGQQAGFSFRLLCKDQNEPAAQVMGTSNVTFGDPHKIEDLMEFLPKADLITFESEFIPVHQIRAAMERLQKTKQPPKFDFFPSLDCMSNFQDRLSQKQTLEKFKIATAPFIHSEEPKNFEHFLKKHRKVVFKKRIGGYDGYGTYIIQSLVDLNKFLAANDTNDFICEAFMPFKQELAYSFARNGKNQITVFPLVRTTQKDHKCDFIFGPVKHPHVATLTKKISEMLKKINYVGFITFELFDVNGKLTVNEIAPRVHNSAHYSVDALNVNQFLAHLKMGLGMEIPIPHSSTKYFAMTNLIHLPESKLINQKWITGKLHWYGKSESRPGRKMGHINYIGKDAAVLKQALLERKKLYEK